LTALVDWPAGARELVEGLEVARLATVEPDGQPHVVPICFVVIGDTLYSVVDAKPKRRPLALKRLSNLAANPRATVVADRYDADWTRLAWAMLGGRAALVGDDGEYARALGRLAAKYAQYRTTALARVTNPMIALRIERVRYWTYQTPTTR
jgi:PPOX class probable F420-dependent enzyme